MLNMHKAVSLSPTQERLIQIQSVLEDIYDQLQSLIEQDSQAWFWTAEVQKEIQKSEDDIKHGNTSLFSNADDLLKDLHAHVQT